MASVVRPTVLCAIIFGVLAAIIPRIIIPIIRQKPVVIRSHGQDHRSAPLVTTESSIPRDDFVSRSDSDLSSSFTPNDVFDSSSTSDRKLTGHSQQINQSLIPNFGIPMYIIGIFLFIVYTCCKYFSKAGQREKYIQQRYSSKNIRWNTDQHRFKYEVNNQRNMEEEEEADDEYAGLDPDYVQYLKSKRLNELEAERRLTTEQKQMNTTLDSMKQSLSFINTKLATKKTGGSLSESEISQLQNRLAATEAQMFQIISALDAASAKVQQLTKVTHPSIENRAELISDVEDDFKLMSPIPSLPVGRESLSYEEENSASDNGEDENEDDDDDEDEDEVDEEDDESSSPQQDKPVDKDDESSSSYEEDDEPLSEEEEEDDDDDEESENSLGRYGLMETNYDCDLNAVDDYDLDPTATINDAPQDSREKVEEWRQRHHSDATGDQITPEIIPDPEPQEKSQ